MLNDLYRKLLSQCVCVREGKAYRVCTADGSWWLNPDNRTWSNYTQCINTDLLVVCHLIGLSNITHTHTHTHAASANVFRRLQMSLSDQVCLFV